MASAIAVQRIREIDGPQQSAEQAVEALRDSLVAANATLSEVVREHPELTGMGTTVSAMLDRTMVATRIWVREPSPLASATVPTSSRPPARMRGTNSSQ